MVIYELCAVLAKSRVPYAVVGGYAVSLHGAVRGTLDIDVVIEWSLPNLRALEKALISYSLQSRLPVSGEDIFNFRDEYVKNRNLVAWNFYNPQRPDIQIDVIINFDLKGKKVKTIRTKNGTIRVLDIDDLIAMKKQSSRQQDQFDIEALQKIKQKR